MAWTLASLSGTRTLNVLAFRPGRKKPYTQEGVKRLPCARCGAKAHASWQVCADGRLFRPICWKCDVALNRIVLKFMKDPDVEEKMMEYIKKMNPRAEK